MMRTFFLITLLALLPTLSFGQDVYHTFLEEGKVWKFHYHKPFTNGGSDKSIVVKGDTVIGETTYKKIVNVSNNQCEIVMRENKRKIYYLNPNGNESLIYDFGLNVGDVFHLESESTVIAVDTIIVGDHAFRALKLVGEWDKEHYFWWVEGIGNLCYLINSIPAPGDYYKFLQCQLGEEVLFSQNDFKTLDEYTGTGIDNTRIKENSINSPLFDLQGRRINGQPKKGLYIRDGKKYVK